MTLTRNLTIVVYSCRLLGILCDFISKDIPDFPPEAEKPVDSIAKLFIFHLTNKSAVQRFVVGQVTYEWANASQVREYSFLS